jgi:CDP-diacylglycerol--serine O-phosphatidyltransferase
MKHVPNIITCLNLFAGCLACMMVLGYGNYFGALIFMLLAAVFDFLDGFAARALKAYSPIGAQLDSLADVISFGMAPACILYAFLFEISTHFPLREGICFFPFLITIFAALRLAKFNVDTRQTESFLGLPVPANGLFWAALIPAIFPYIDNNESLISGIILGLIIIFCLLMVSEIPMFSLKFKNYSWENNKYAYILIGLSIVFIFAFKVLGISLIIVAYILLSLFKNTFSSRLSS